MFSTYRLIKSVGEITGDMRSSPYGGRKREEGGQREGWRKGEKERECVKESSSTSWYTAVEEQWQEHGDPAGRRVKDRQWESPPRTGKGRGGLAEGLRVQGQPVQKATQGHLMGKAEGMKIARSFQN